MYVSFLRNWSLLTKEHGSILMSAQDQETRMKEDVLPQQLELWGLCQYRLRGGFPGAGSRKVPAGSRKVPGQVLKHGFREGSGAGSERQVPELLRVGD